jgi:DNA polymerase III subunit delta
MAEGLDEALEELDAGGEVPVYLLHGEEFLVRQGADALLAKLVPGASVGLNLVPLDGASPREVAAELDTLPLFPGRKVVLLKDPEFLAPKKGRTDALGKARDAWKANRRKEAARRVLALAARAGWGVAELDPSASGAPGVDRWDEELGQSLAQADLQFLKEVADFCRAEGLTAPSGDESALLEWLNGKPIKGQVLVIAATDVETKSAFVKAVKDKGRYLERRVAARLKDLDITTFAAEILAPFKKKMAGSALEKLKDRVGGNMRLVQSELVKLALYVEGDNITEKDVTAVVQHAREEEFFELSEALQKRDLNAALKYVGEAKSQGKHELLILGTVTSVIRTLLMNHERLQALSGGKPPRNFNDFKDRVFPKIEAEVKATKGKVPHPYAAFMSMQAAAGYGRAELCRALAACAETDLSLKLGGGQLAIERLLWSIAGKVPFWDSGMHTIRRENER